MKYYTENKVDVIKLLRDEKVFPEEIIKELDKPIFSETARIIEYKKGEMLIRTGDDIHYIYVVIEGVVRGFLIKPNGQEMTDSLLYQKGFPVIPSSDMTMPSPMNYSVLTDSRIMRIPIDNVRNIVRDNNILLRYVIYLFSQHLRFHRESKAARYLFASGERYQWFLREYSELVGKISNKVIATFIGVTPETLSRIQNTKDESSEQ